VLRMKPYQPPRTNILHRLFYYPLRLASLLFCVIHTLWVQLHQVPHTKTPVDVMLVQNPPSVPTLMLGYLFCLWQGIKTRGRRPRFVIDWHNLGFSMFESSTQRTLAKFYERIVGPLADAHLCVTHAMEVWLGENFDVHGKRVRVLYDKPPFMFGPTRVEEQHDLFSRLELDKEERHFGCNDGRSKTKIEFWLEELRIRDEVDAGELVEETLLTQMIINRNGESKISLRKNRPALLVSSTSWTPDEDFSILLKALEKLQSSIGKRNNFQRFPKILIIVTGKGPEKSHYLPLLKKFNDSHPQISIYTIWLRADDYPKLLGCATLGISLHTSTSGLDLPMKVLDMFGCQVPVCAVGFDCISELVKDGVNGRVFGNEDELAKQLYELLKSYPENCNTDLDRYRKNIEGTARWRENWDECAKDLVVGNWINEKSRRQDFHWTIKFLVFALSYSVMYWFAFKRINKSD